MRSLLNNLDPTKSLNEIFRRTRAAVAEKARAAQHQQHPAIYDQTTSDFTLIGLPIENPQFNVPAVGIIPELGSISIGNKYRSISLDDGLRSASEMNAVLESLSGGFRKGTVLYNFSLDPVPDHINRMVESGCKNLIVYWSGLSSFDGEDCVLYPSSAKTNRAANELVEVVNGGVRLADLIRHAHRDGINLLVIIDSTLMKMPVETMTDAKWLPRQNDLLSLSALMHPTFETDDQDPLSGEISILFASNFFQEANAVQAASSNQSSRLSEGMPRSPFVQALINAFERPGMTLQQFADYVRQEVEITSGGRLSPFFVTAEKRRNAVLVKPKLRG